MTAAAAYEVRGSCPGALQPMESGDGLIVRVRPRAGTLTLAQARGLADASLHHGNGHIDLTRRANLQIRGVTAHSLAALQSDLAELDLIDADGDGEAVRNIVVSPLAGADPDEVLDVRPLARALERVLATDRALWRLPGKFGFIIDGGGALSLDDVRADVRLIAVRGAGRVVMAVSLDRANTPLHLGAVATTDAVATARRIAVAFLETQSPGSRVRLRDLTPDALKHVCNVTAPLFWQSELTDTDVSGGHPIGLLRGAGKVFAVGVALPFGRVEADALSKFADATVEAGSDELRVSAWRTLYVPIDDEARAMRVLGAARGLGFIVDEGDPLLGIEACPGAPSCRSGFADTRAAARAVAEMRAKLTGVTTIHVSGCAKGCACPGRADLVLAGGPDGFGVMRHARAGDTAEAFIHPRNLAGLPEILSRLARERCDA